MGISRRAPALTDKEAEVDHILVVDSLAEGEGSRRLDVHPRIVDPDNTTCHPISGMLDRKFSKYEDGTCEV